MQQFSVNSALGYEGLNLRSTRKFSLPAGPQAKLRSDSYPIGDASLFCRIVSSFHNSEKLKARGQ